MIPKRERFTSIDLKNNRNIKGKRLNAKFGFFLIFPLKQGEIGKKGIILSKKNFKTAVLRNKYRRLFYNVLRSLESRTKHSILFSPKQEFSEEELREVLLNVIQ